MFLFIISSFSVKEKRIPVSIRCCREHLHAQFMQNKYMDDPHEIDALIYKSQIELKDSRCMHRDDVIIKCLSTYCKEKAHSSVVVGNIVKM